MQNMALCDWNEWLRSPDSADPILGPLTEDKIDKMLRHLMSGALKKMKQDDKDCNQVIHHASAGDLYPEMAKNLVANFKAFFSRGIWGWICEGLKKKLAGFAAPEQHKAVAAKMMATEFAAAYKSAQSKAAKKEDEFADEENEEGEVAATGDDDDDTEYAEVVAGSKKKRMTIPEKMDAYLKVRKPKSGVRNRLIALSREPLSELYAKYMPESLKPIVPVPIEVGLSGKRKQSEGTVKPSCKRRKAGNDENDDYVPVETAETVKVADATLGQKMVFVRSLNNDAFVQALFPGPQVKAWMRLFTPTMVSAAVSGFVKSRDQESQDKLQTALNEQCELVHGVLVQQFGFKKDIGKVKDWTDFKLLRSRQLLVLPCIFPPLLGLPFTGQLAKNGEVPSEIKEKRKGQDKEWHRMWRGSMCTNGHRVYFHVYDSTRHTAFEKGYRYSNLLSVSINTR